MTGQETGPTSTLPAEPGSLVESDTNPPSDAERPPLILVATSSDGNVYFDPASGSTTIPAHWLPEAS